jgi:hypothetical protein
MEDNVNINRSSSNLKNKKKYIAVEYNSNNNNNIDTINPSIVLFPQNFPNLDLINDSDTTSWCLGQNKDKKLKDDKILIGQNHKILFESKNRPSNNLSEYVLGVYHKRKRDLKIYDIEGIFPMTQKIRRVEAHSQKIENENLMSMSEISKPDNEPGSNLRDKVDLIHNFGTMKSKKHAQNMENNIVSESSISSVNAVKRILEDNAKSQEMILHTSAEDQNKNKLLNMTEILPSFNLETKNVREVFDLSGLLDEEIINKIDHKSTLKMLKNNGKGLEENRHMFSEFIYTFLTTLIKPVSENKKVTNKIKVGLFLDDMIKFLNAPLTILDPQRTANDKQIFIDNFNLFLNLFTETSFHFEHKLKYIKTPYLKLKNIYHVLILALFIRDYSFDFSSLARSMRMEVKQLHHYYKEIGCGFGSAGSGGTGAKDKFKTTVVSLKAPLKLNLDYKKF